MGNNLKSSIQELTKHQADVNTYEEKAKEEEEIIKELKFLSIL